MTKKEKKERARDIAKTYKSKGCEDCGNKTYSEIEYNNREEIRRLIKNGSCDKLESEITKIGVTCINCRLKTKKMKDVSITARFDYDLNLYLTRMANKDGISKSNLLRRLVREEYIRRLHGE